MNAKQRIRNKALLDRVMSAGEAAAKIKDGMVVAVSGFTSSGYPKLVPEALAERARNGEDIDIDLYTGASVGPEIDGLFAEADMIRRRLPYQTNGKLRSRINEGRTEYVDIHLSQSPQYINYGVVKSIDVAIVEAAGITEKGGIIPTASVGSTPAFVKNSKKIIVEINTSIPAEIEGIADIMIPENPPMRKPINICHPADRIGTPYIECDPDKIIAVVFSDRKDTMRPFKEVDDVSKRISAHIIDFLEKEIAAGRLEKSLLPLQSGVGSVANAVFYGLADYGYKDLTCYTEVVQDSMLDMIRNGNITAASTTAVSPSQEKMQEFLDDMEFFKSRIVMRPQDISNSPEVIRRLGVIAMNTAIEADIYGNVNSTHIIGSRMMNGIGGSGDFSRNAAISIFCTPSTAKDGNISSIVPMVSHTDHTEHEVMVIVTEYGYADLRGLSPKERAIKIIENCAHPDYRDMLHDYFRRACNSSALHTPHIPEEALSWHSRYLKTGCMK